jgi:hypothetical protein
MRPRRRGFLPLGAAFLAAVCASLSAGGAGAAAPVLVDDPVRPLAPNERLALEALRARVPSAAEAIEALLDGRGTAAGNSPTSGPMSAGGNGRHQPPDSIPPRIEQDWYPLTPGGRWGHRMLADPAHDRVIVAGGSLYDAEFSTCWGFDLSRPDSPYPATALLGATIGYEPAVTLDTRRDQLLVYGGASMGVVDAAPGYWRADTWGAYASPLDDPNGWTNLPSARSPAGPGARHGATAIYDSLRDRMIVFGGETYDETYGYLGITHTHFDTWALHLGASAAWESLLTNGSTPHRDYGSAALDPAHDRMVYVAGGSVWTLGLASSRWDSLANETPPPPFEGFLTIDPATSRGFLSAFGEVWRLDLDSPGRVRWTRLAVTGDGPSGDGQVVWDEHRGRLVTFSGALAPGHQQLDYSQPTSAVLWSIDPDAPTPTWRPEYDGRTPGVDLNSPFYDARRQRLIAIDRFAPLSAPYVMPDGATSWSRLAGPPASGAIYGSVAMDEAHDRLVLITSDVNETATWLYPLDGTQGWQRIDPTPPEFMEVAYDADAQAPVAIGWDDVVPAHVWRLVDTGDTPSWRPVPTTGQTMPARYEALIASDPDRGRVFVVGGFSVFNYHFDTDSLWTLTVGDTARWTVRSGLSYWVPDDDTMIPAMAWEPVQQRLVLHGVYVTSAGWSYDGAIIDPERSAYAFDGVTGMFAVPMRGNHGMTYDPIHRRVLIVGGHGPRPNYVPAPNGNDVMSDVWGYSFTAPQRTVRVSVRGNSGSQRLNPGSLGTMVVTIYGEPDFDARALELETVRVAGVPVRHDGGGRPIYTVRDADHDGLPDIEIHFDVGDLPITNENHAVAVWGRTYDQTPIWGVAPITPVGPPSAELNGSPSSSAPLAPTLFATVSRSSGGASVECRISGLGPGRVELFDVNGRRLATKAFETGTGRGADVSVGDTRLTTGLYFVRASDGRNTLHAKVIVLH